MMNHDRARVVGSTRSSRSVTAQVWTTPAAGARTMTDGCNGCAPSTDESSMITISGFQRRAMVVLLLAGATLVAGCGDPDSGTTASASRPAATTARTWVGAMAGTDAFVAVVVDGSRA